jgi:hypothetical protein
VREVVLRDRGGAKRDLLWRGSRDVDRQAEGCLEAPTPS